LQVVRVKKCLAVRLQVYTVDVKTLLVTRVHSSPLYSRHGHLV